MDDIQTWLPVTGVVALTVGFFGWVAYSLRQPVSSPQMVRDAQGNAVGWKGGRKTRKSKSKHNKTSR